LARLLDGAGDHPGSLLMEFLVAARVIAHAQRQALALVLDRDSLNRGRKLLGLKVLRTQPPLPRISRSPHGSCALTALWSDAGEARRVVVPVGVALLLRAGGVVGCNEEASDVEKLVLRNEAC
jgi:hypothetical protein